MLRLLARQFGAGLVLTSLVFSPVNGALAADLPESNENSDVTSIRLEVLTAAAKEVFKQEGSDGLLRYMRRQADGGLDVQPLRQYALNFNHGKPIAVVVDVHPDMKEAVQFANDQLKISGLDFFEFKPHFNSALPAPSEPFRADAASYHKWRTLREYLIPFVGFAACLIQAGNEMAATHGSVSAVGMAPYLAQAFVIVGLEWQFAHFTNWWNHKFWSDSRQGLPPIPEVVKAKLTESMRELVDQVNQGILLINKAIPQGVQANHIWNLMVNYLYAGTVYTTGMIVASMTGNTDFHFGFLRILRDSFLSTSVFFYGYGLTQILIGQFTSRGQISEYQRMRVESVGSYWGNLGRSISLIPGLQQVGLYMMGAWGAFVTTPLIARSLGAKAYAKRTKKIFDSNEQGAGPVVAESTCDKLLSTAFERINFPAYHGN